MDNRSPVEPDDERDERTGIPDEEYVFSEEITSRDSDNVSRMAAAPPQRETRRSKRMSTHNFKDTFTLVQRYLINTIFDSINSSVGIILGLYLSGSSDGYIFAMSVLSAMIALGISSGTSTYEAEYLEQLNALKEIQSHMLEDSTALSKSSARKKAVLVGASNFLTPTGLASLVAITFLATVDINLAVIISITFLIATLFFTGVVFGIMNNISPLKRGLRMLVIGLASFCIVYLLGFLT